MGDGSFPQLYNPSVLSGYHNAGNRTAPLARRYLEILRKGEEE